MRLKFSIFYEICFSTVVCERIVKFHMVRDMSVVNVVCRLLRYVQFTLCHCDLVAHKSKLLRVCSIQI